MTRYIGGLWMYFGKRTSLVNGQNGHNIVGGRVGININGVPGNYFRTFKGLRQGNPLSQHLFNLVSDALAKMLTNAQAGEIKVLVPNLIDGGFTHLQYADDTIIFLELDEQSITNTKFLLYNVLWEHLKRSRIKQLIY